MAGPDKAEAAAALKASLDTHDAPPEGAGGPLAALWHAGKGNADKALALLEGDAGREAAWVRAHLHRRRGETAEAADWYGRAGRQVSADPVDQEWSQIAMGIMLAR